MFQKEMISESEADRVFPFGTSRNRPGMRHSLFLTIFSKSWRIRISELVMQSAIPLFSPVFKGKRLSKTTGAFLMPIFEE